MSGIATQAGMFWAPVAGGGAGAGYPQILQTTTYNTGTTAATDHIISLPSSRAVGDLVVIVFRSISSITAPSGWSVGNTNGSLYVLSRVMDGTESSTVTIVGALSRVALAFAMRIAPAVSAEHAVSANNIVDPPSLTASWGSAKNLWITAFSGGYGSGRFTAAPPSGYGNLQTIETSPGSTASAQQTLAIATREMETATEDPATWVITQITGDTTGARTSTIAIRP
jgi:hypothetical protein